ncbi:MAG: hypothetical protein NC078_04925 [Ruminococcus sp.]|nr:hypothetical protein [Ruminococcus sp.]
MIISSEKANKRVRRIVGFASKHKWAKYPGIAAVSAVYGVDWLRAVVLEAGEKIRESANAPFRPLAGRAGSALLAAAFALMTVPVGFTAGAEELDGAAPAAGESLWGGEANPGAGSEEALLDDGGESTDEALLDDGSKSAEDVLLDDGEETAGDGDNDSASAAEAADGEEDVNGDGSEETSPKRVTRERTRPKRKWMAKTDEEIAGRVTLEGLPEYGEGYGITLNVENLGRDVTARFSSRREMIDRVKYCFECYEIPTDNLYIAPVDVTIYSTDDRTVLQFREDKGCSADITLPVPDEFDGHTEDLKVVRLDDGNRMTVLDCDVAETESGRTLTFNTEHFSVFAMIAYRQMPGAASTEEPEMTENIQSGASSAAAGVQASAAVNANISPFDEDKRRFGKGRGKKRVYRIKRICKEYEKLL